VTHVRVLAIMMAATGTAVLCGCGAGAGNLAAAGSAKSGGGSVPTSIAPKGTLDGKIEIPGDCGSEVGYSDLHQGGQVVVKDGNGSILGIATIGSPTPFGIYEVPATPPVVVTPAQPATPPVVVTPAQPATPSSVVVSAQPPTPSSTIAGDLSLGVPPIVIPGSPGTPAITVPGSPAQPAVTIPGTPAQPAVTIPGTPAHTANQGCDFPFVVPSLPKTNFYQIAAGHRTPVTYTRAQLDENGWVVSLTISG
jgi:hypothetical protein